jgi:hypothetical protein
MAGIVGVTAAVTGIAKAIALRPIKNSVIKNQRKLVFYFLVFVA